MERVQLDVDMEDDLIAKTRDLAVRYFGDDSDESLAQVLEVALRIRYLWSRSVGRGRQETDEAVSSWECAESPITEESNGTIRDWLFRR